ncbi:MAG: hypothetical protein LLG44_12215, partial [Chloroflexi bacterium]|nr:hypothetical protein [Chloroflexota bacterium]
GGEGTLFENMVPDEESLVLITASGQAKRLPAEGARMEEGQLVPGISPQEGDTPRWLLAAHSKDTLYFIDTLGHAQVLAAHQVPDIAQQEHGLPLKNLLHLPNGEQIAAVLAVNELSEDRYMTFFTRQGKVKRVVLSELSSLGAGGVVIGIAEGDALLRALITDGQQELLVVSANGRALRFKEDEVRPQGRAGGGMRAIALAEGDEVVGAETALPDGELVVVSQQAYAKRCPLNEFNTQGRGGQGVYAVDASKQKDAGPLAFALAALPQDDIVFVTEEKRMVRRALHDLPELPRASWGRIVSPSRKGAVLILGDDKLSGILALAAGIPKATGAPPAPELEAKAASSRKIITETSLLATKDDKKQATPKAHAQVMKTAVVKPDAKSSKAQVAPSRPAAKPATKSVKRGAAVKAPNEPLEKTARSQPARSADTAPKAAVTTKGANAPVKEPAKPKAVQAGAVGSAAKVAASRTDAADESAHTKSSATKSAKPAPSQAAAGTTVGKPASAGAANKSAAKSASASAPTEPKPSLRKSKTDKAMPALTQQESAAKTAHKPAAAPTTAAQSAQEAVQPAPTQAELPIPDASAARGRRVVSKKPQRSLVPHATKEKE